MLAKNTLLEQIAEELGKAPPIDERVVRNFSDIDIVRYGLYDSQRLSSLLSEVWLTTRLEELQHKLNGEIVLNPIPNGAEVNPYKYVYYGSNLTIYQKNNVPPRTKVRGLNGTCFLDAQSATPH